MCIPRNSHVFTNANKIEIEINIIQQNLHLINLRLLINQTLRFLQNNISRIENEQQIRERRKKCKCKRKYEEKVFNIIRSSYKAALKFIKYIRISSQTIIRPYRQLILLEIIKLFKKTVLDLNKKAALYLEPK